MICNIRGTSGSGKTTAVRKIMEMGSVEPIGRTSLSRVGTGPRVMKPAGYLVRLIGFKKPIHIVGHYETPTGGCDTMGSVGPTFRRIAEFHEAGHHVLFEGLLISRSKGRMIELWDQVGPGIMKAFHLNTSLEQCLEGIAARRAAIGNVKPVDPMQTTATYDRVLQISESFRASGYPIQFVTREEVVNRILEAFYLDEGIKIHVRARTPQSA